MNYLKKNELGDIRKRIPYTSCAMLCNPLLIQVRNSITFWNMGGTRPVWTVSHERSRATDAKARSSPRQSSTIIHSLTWKVNKKKKHYLKEIRFNAKRQKQRKSFFLLLLLLHARVFCFFEKKIIFFFNKKILLDMEMDRKRAEYSLESILSWLK